jgi:hypothetical protein
MYQVFLDWEKISKTILEKVFLCFFETIADFWTKPLKIEKMSFLKYSYNSLTNPKMCAAYQF